MSRKDFDLVVRWYPTTDEMEFISEEDGKRCRGCGKLTKSHKGRHGQTAHISDCEFIQDTNPYHYED